MVSVASIWSVLDFNSGSTRTLARMSNELPIACSLSSADLAERLAEMNSLGRSALLDVEQDATRAVLRFRAGDQTAERLSAIVEAEAHCCAFLDMSIDARGDALTLIIDAPAGAGLVVDELVEAFTTAAAAAASVGTMPA